MNVSSYSGQKVLSDYISRSLHLPWSSSQSKDKEAPGVYLEGLEANKEMSPMYHCTSLAQHLHKRNDNNNMIDYQDCGKHCVTLHHAE